MRNIVKRPRRKLGDDADNPTYIFAEPRVVSITEHADDTPTGKLMEAIIESVDEFYSENLAHSQVAWQTCFRKALNAIVTAPSVFISANWVTTWHASENVSLMVAR